MMGQLFASQVHHAIARDVLQVNDAANAIYIGDTRVGEFMKDKVFSPAACYTWNDLTKFATGEELNPKAFAESSADKPEASARDFTSSKHQRGPRPLPIPYFPLPIR